MTFGPSLGSWRLRCPQPPSPPAPKPYQRGLTLACRWRHEAASLVHDSCLGLYPFKAALGLAVAAPATDRRLGRPAPHPPQPRHSNIGRVGAQPPPLRDLRTARLS